MAEITTTAVFDIDALKVLLANPHLNDVEQNRKLKAIGKKHNNGLMKLKYEFSKSDAGSLGYGRLYCRGWHDIGSLKRNVRGTLCHNYYWDIDTVNCQPTILFQIMSKNGFSAKQLERYVNNRESVFKMLNDKFHINRDEAKKAIISILNGSENKFYDKCEYLILLRDEWKTFIEIEMDKPEYADLLEVVKNKPNAKGSFASAIISKEERKVLEALYRLLKSEKRSPDILMFDGLMFRKDEGETEPPSYLLEKCHLYVKRETGYDLRFAYKEMETIDLDADDIEKPSTPEEISDLYACQQFVKHMGNNMIYQNDKIYIYDSRTGLWESGKNAVIKAVHSVAKHLVFETESKKYDYGGNTTKMKAMLHFLESLMTPTTEINPQANKYCFLFKNGWFDMRTMTFTSGFDGGCKAKYFTKRILRDFSPARNSEIERTVFTVLFENPYNNFTVGKMYLNGVARAMAGIVEDKVWWSIVGNSNCGKGVMTAILSHTFQEYVDCFNMNVLKQSTHDSTDEAKKMAWYAPLIGCRIAAA